jgi:hypothetical protein
MAISKRLRFEILRRDEHACQYCGEKAPGVTLHVDHVVPVTLGGSDKPDNLVAACKDCNLGKTSVPSGAPLVAAIGKMAAAYALDMTERMTTIRANIEYEDGYLEEFEDTWEAWATRTNKRAPLPDDYRTSLYRWAKMGVPMPLIARAIEIAMTKTGIKTRDGQFSYMAGVVWRALEDVEVAADLTEATVHTFTELEAHELMVAGYEKGFKRGMERAA